MSLRSRRVALIVGIASVATATLALSATMGSADPLGQITTVATEGTTPGFTANDVRSITTGPDGLQWYTSFDRVSRVNADSTVSEFTAGLTGDSLQGITAGPDGNVWFTEFNPPGKVAKVSPTGTITEVAVFGTTPNFVDGNVEDITTGPDGNLWFTMPFTNASTGRIGRITTAGVVTMFTPPGANAQPRSITTGPDGNLWYTDDGDTGSIFTISTNGAFTERAVGGVTAGFSHDAFPYEITPGPDGALWFVESRGAVGRITTANVVTEFDAPVQDASLTDITSGCGNLWVTQGGEVGPSQILQLSTVGTYTGFTVGLPAQPNLEGITFGPDQNLWITNNSEPASIIRMGTGCAVPPPTTTTSTSTTSTAPPITNVPAVPLRVSPAYTG